MASSFVDFLNPLGSESTNLIVNADQTVDVLTATGSMLRLPQEITDMGLPTSTPGVIHSGFHGYRGSTHVGYVPGSAYDTASDIAVSLGSRLPPPTTVENAFTALRYFPAPKHDGLIPSRSLDLYDRPINTGDTTEVLYAGTNNLAGIGSEGGFVSHYVYPEHNIVINVTQAGHVLHPGIVVRQIEVRDGLIYVRTEGIGVGDFAALNNSADVTVFFPMDLLIEDLLNGYGSEPIPSSADQIDVERLKVLQECFLAGTPISMWDGTEKPIEQIRPGDIVMSYDEDGSLMPGRVSQMFQNQAKHILDVFGLHMTPGHVTFCGDGVFAGRHVPIIDILRSDGALVHKDGTKVRANTGEALGSDKDSFIWAVAGEKLDNGAVKVHDKGQIRLGTRYIVDDGRDISVHDLILDAGGTITPAGLVSGYDNVGAAPFFWPFTEMLPKPESYILQRSAVHLSEIYQASEWEALPPQMPVPVGPDGNPIRPANEAVLETMPPNVPLSSENGPLEPSMDHKQRKEDSARNRRSDKQVGGSSTIH